MSICQRCEYHDKLTETKLHNVSQIFVLFTYENILIHKHVIKLFRYVCVWYMTQQGDIDIFDIMAIIHVRQAITLTSENMKNTTSRHFEGEKENESKFRTNHSSLPV